MSKQKIRLIFIYICSLFNLCNVMGVIIEEVPETSLNGPHRGYYHLSPTKVELPDEKAVSLKGAVSKHRFTTNEVRSIRDTYLKSCKGREARKSSVDSVLLITVAVALGIFPLYAAYNYYKNRSAQKPKTEISSS